VRFEGLADARTLLRARDPGAKVMLTVKRTGEMKQFEFVLEDLI
jgi:hypothetical protein